MFYRRARSQACGRRYNKVDYKATSVGRTKDRRKKKTTTYFHRLSSLLETGSVFGISQSCTVEERSLEPTCKISLVFVYICL